MGKKVICYIQAFDCEKTIEAAMRSVLNQTYDNWLCFVLSNGNQNTAKTPNWSFDVIRHIAACDNRFIILNKRKNRIDIYIPMLFYLAQHFPNAYICSLDADDEYKSDFFERAVSWMEEKQLDIVACGTEITLKKWAGAKSERLLSKREVNENLVINREAYTSQFALYKPFFNEMWGKLYSTNLFGNRYDEQYAYCKFFRRFLPDTLFTIDTLSRSQAIGILSGTSHKFYQFEQRTATNATVIANEFVANHQKKTRYLFSIYDTYKTVMFFLHSHGKIDSVLYEYMQAVLFGWFGDFYSRTLLLTTDEAKLANHVYRLVFHPKFDELMQYQDSGKYDNLRNYEKRKDYCERLRNMMICQTIIRNRKLWKLENLHCTSHTKREIGKIIAKLDDMILTLSTLQSKGGLPC